MSEDIVHTTAKETAKDKYIELVTARKQKAMEDQGYRWFPDKQGGTWRDTLGRIVEKILTPEAGKKQRELMEAAKQSSREALEDVSEETPWGICKGCGVAREDYQTEEALRRTNEEIHCDVCGMNPGTGEKPKIITGDPEGYYLVSESLLKRNSGGRGMGPPSSGFSARNFRNNRKPSGPYDVPDALRRENLRS